MVLPVNDDLSQVAVMFPNAQYDVSSGRAIEHCVQLPEMICYVFSDGRRNREVAACEFDLHPNAPFFTARSPGLNNRAVACQMAVWTVVGRANQNGWEF